MASALNNKQEFRDAVSLRYGWRIANTPQFCGRGKENSIDHTLICAKGGYISIRHNALRDFNTELQSEVCKDITIEPSLLPLDSEEISGTSANRAAPDIYSRGLWIAFQHTFFDVRVIHQNAPSYLNIPLSSLQKTRKREDEEVQLMSPNCGEGHIHPFSIFNFRWLWPSSKTIS